MAMLIQLVYAPFNVRLLRNDLSGAMKELILACLEVEVSKRRLFSELEGTWFFKRLFDRRYNEGENISRINNCKNVDEQLPEVFLAKHASHRCAPSHAQCNRYLGSRFKEKVSEDLHNMNYDSHSRSKNKRQLDPG
jgi:hypothetical protein